jgi:hypothetical protein
MYFAERLLQNNGKMKTETELIPIFTCGFGVTAAILALDTSLVKSDNFAVL